MNCLVQMVVLNLHPAQGEEKGHFSSNQTATYVANESLIGYHSALLFLGRETSVCVGGQKIKNKASKDPVPEGTKMINKTATALLNTLLIPCLLKRIP